MAKKMSKKAAPKAAKPAPKAAAPKTVAAKPVKITAAGKIRTKGEVYTTIAEASGLPRKQVANVFDILGSMIAADIKSKPGVFAVPGLMKITCVVKPATKEREGVNPFTGEKMVFKAKPARKAIKVRPLKGLKAMVS